MRTILAASGVVMDEDGRLLLVVRTKPPEAGSWTVPGGSVDPSETLEQAAAREVLEETGICVRIKQELWSLTQPAGPDAVYEIHDFLAEPIGGTLQAGDDAGDAQWFTPQELEHAHLSHDLLGYLQRAGLYKSPSTTRGTDTVDRDGQRNR